MDNSNRSLPPHIEDEYEPFMEEGHGGPDRYVPYADDLSTPVNANPMINFSAQEFASKNPNLHNSFYSNKPESCASLASSISDYPTSSGIINNARNYNPSPKFLNLLLESYQLVCTDPKVTPFDTTNPPFGILNRTAKFALEQAKLRAIDIGDEKENTLIPLLRQKLLFEIRKDGYASRNVSVSSLQAPNFSLQEYVSMEDNWKNPPTLETMYANQNDNQLFASKPPIAKNPSFIRAKYNNSPYHGMNRTRSASTNSNSNRLGTPLTLQTSSIGTDYWNPPQSAATPLSSSGWRPFIHPVSRQRSNDSTGNIVMPSSIKANQIGNILRSNNNGGSGPEPPCTEDQPGT